MQKNGPVRKKRFRRSNARISCRAQWPMTIFSRMLVATQDLRRAVNRQIVGGNEKINAMCDVKIEIAREDILFIARQESHH
jgi:hypothetical protein